MPREGRTKRPAASSPRDECGDFDLDQKIREGKRRYGHGRGRNRARQKFGAGLREHRDIADVNEKGGDLENVLQVAAEKLQVVADVLERELRLRTDAAGDGLSRGQVLTGLAG